MDDPKTAPQRIVRFDSNPFLDGPTQGIVKAVATQLSVVPQFKLIFGANIDEYKRSDYGISNLPAIRFYNEDFIKESEDWFINGDVIADALFPPNIRRKQLQVLQDVLAAALMQQFRRTSFFNACQELAPGLNQLGRVFRVDKKMGFEWSDGIIPLTRFTINFRLDLRAWDIYLEASNRTVDDPFVKSLEDLKTIMLDIQGVE